MTPPRANLASFLDDLASRPDAPAFGLRTPYRCFRWSCGETHRAALALAALLRERGTAPGDKVILSGPSSPEWAASLLGILAAGGIAVPLDETSSPELAKRVAAKVGARAAIVPDARAPEIAAALAAATGATGAEGQTRGLARGDVAGAPAVVSLESLRELARSPGPLPAPHRAALDDTAEIVFTSGTTAEPRGVELSHANLLSGLRGIEEGFRAREWYLRPFLPLELLCLVPLSHLFGQTVGIFVPMLLRSECLFATSLQPARVLRDLGKERPLVLIAVPRTLAGLAEAVRRELARRGRLERFERGYRKAASRSLLSRIVLTRAVRRVVGWRTWGLVVGGAALEAEVEEFWMRCGMLVIQGYGMTEAAPIITVHNPLDGAARSIGRGVGEQEVRLAEDGEIIVRGPNIMKGYFGDPGATREVLRDGWLHTGDIGAMDAEGRLFFKGRKKDVIVTSDGMNVHPSDIEEVLRAAPGVKEVVVFALPGARGEEVHAALLPEGRNLDPESVRQAANEKLLPHQRLRGAIVWTLPEFPRTATGKVKRGEVAAAVRAAAMGSGARTPRQQDLPASIGRVAAAIERLRGGSHHGIAAVFASGDAGASDGARLAEDLGLTSLEMVELIGLLEEEHDVILDDRQVRSSLTVGDLEQLVTSGGEEAIRVRMPRWTRAAPFRWLRALLVRPIILRTLYAPFVSLEVRGKEHLEGARGPFLVVANHQSLLDVPAILRGIPYPLLARVAPAMAIEVLPDHFEPEGKPLARRLRSALLYNLAVLCFGAYPLPQSRGFRPSLEYTGELIDRGFSPLIFPEGERTPDGRMQPFKRGIGLLAVETRVPVVPIRIEGLDVIMHRDASWPTRGRARVIVGPPFDPLAGGLTSPDEVSTSIEKAVRSL